MGIDVLEYEIETRFPELGNDMANWIGFRYTDSKTMFKAVYNKALDRFLDGMRKLSNKILEATEQLKSIKPVSDTDNNKERLVKYYNSVYEMHQLTKKVYGEIQLIGAVEPEITFELKELIQHLHNQRKVLLNIIEGDLREALNDHSKNGLLEKSDNLS